MTSHFADVALGMASGISFSAAIHERKWSEVASGVIYLIMACLPW